jgi:hypothetical protein
MLTFHTEQHSMDCRVEPGNDGVSAARFPLLVMRGLDPRIPAERATSGEALWIAGSSPAMTTCVGMGHRPFLFEAPALPSSREQRERRGGVGGGGLFLFFENTPLARISCADAHFPPRRKRGEGKGCGLRHIHTRQCGSSSD